MDSDSEDDMPASQFESLNLGVTKNRHMYERIESDGVIISVPVHESCTCTKCMEKLVAVHQHQATFTPDKEEDVPPRPPAPIAAGPGTMYEDGYSSTSSSSEEEYETQNNEFDSD